MPTEEETRAELHRILSQRRQNAAKTRWARLAGSTSDYNARYDATKALMRDPGWDPTIQVLPEERVANDPQRK